MEIDGDKYKLEENGTSISIYKCDGSQAKACLAQVSLSLSQLYDALGVPREAIDSLFPNKPSFSKLVENPVCEEAFWDHFAQIDLLKASIECEEGGLYQEYPCSINLLGVAYLQLFLTACYPNLPANLPYGVSFREDGSTLFPKLGSHPLCSGEGNTATNPEFSCPFTPRQDEESIQRADVEFNRQLEVSKCSCSLEETSQKVGESKIVQEANPKTPFYRIWPYFLGENTPKLPFLRHNVITFIA